MTTIHYAKSDSRFVRLLTAILIGVIMLAFMPVQASAATVSSTSYRTTARTNAGSVYSLESEITLKVGESKVVNLAMSERNGEACNVSWCMPEGYYTYSNVSHGSYWGKSAQITVTGKKAGTSYLYCQIDVNKGKGNPTKVDHASIRCTVKVVDKTTTTTQTTTKPTTVGSVPLKSISLNYNSYSVREGNVLYLWVNYNPANTTDSKTKTWSSSNPQVATVDSSGKVRALRVGTTTITCRVGNKTASMKITVYGNGSSSYSSGNTSNSGNKNSSGNTVRVTNPKPANGYLNVNDVYKQIDAFRTTSGVWYWNQNNRSKTVFNKNGNNRLFCLKRSTKLENTAKIRAKEIAKYYSHTRPNGESCFTAYPNYSYLGENIAYGQKSATEVMEAWKETNEKYSGQSHRRNMLNRNYNAVGVACYQYNGVKYWVQSFGYER